MTSAKRSTRDDFSAAVKRNLAARVNHCCSNPECNAQTSGPQIDPNKSLNVGVAAHIEGAAEGEGSKRYNPNMIPEQRSSINNGIWLCQTCGKKIDDDEVRYTIPVLMAWKEAAEQAALEKNGKSSKGHNVILIVDKWVNSQYAEKAGIRSRLESEGYIVRWSNANKQHERVDLEGWEVVLLDQADGTKAQLKIHDIPAVGGYTIFLKKKKT
jgi:hypothetical protein